MSPQRIRAFNFHSTLAQARLAPVVPLLPPDIELDFIDGDVACSPFDEVRSYFPGPYFCYYKSLSTGAVQNALSRVLKIMEEDGPYDGVIGFSQGAALAATLILHQQTSLDCAFKFAIFLSGHLPYSPDKRFGINLADILAKAGISPDLLREIQRLNPLQYMPLIADSVINACSEKTDSPSSGEERSCTVKASNNSFCHVDPQTESETSFIIHHSVIFRQSRISIPTVHIYGLNDPMLPQARLLTQLCSTMTYKVVEHEGKHEVPRSQESLDRCQSAIDWALARAEHLA